MLFPVMVLEVMLVLVLLGALVRLGLAGRDWTFSCYLSVLFLANTGMWVLAQTAFGKRLYEATYIVVCSVLLLSAAAVVVRGRWGWVAVLLVGLTGSLATWIGKTPLATGRQVYPDYIVCEMVMLLCHLSFGIFAVYQAHPAVTAFDSIKFTGLSLFWIPQAVVSACYVLGYVRGKPVWETATTVSVGLGAIVMAWMAVSFWTSGLEGQRQTVEPTTERPAAVALARRATR